MRIACATTFRTTGTAGRPKGVHFSHRQLVLHTLAGLVDMGSPQARADTIGTTSTRR
jgi:acyl-CoA synthetase (AMP-forming)/AMP-acid ligase II